MWLWRFRPQTAVVRRHLLKRSTKYPRMSLSSTYSHVTKEWQSRTIIKPITKHTARRNHSATIATQCSWNLQNINTTDNTRSWQTKLLSSQYYSHHSRLLERGYQISMVLFVTYTLLKIKWVSESFFALCSCYRTDTNSDHSSKMA